MIDEKLLLEFIRTKKKRNSKKRVSLIIKNTQAPYKIWNLWKL